MAGKNTVIREMASYNRRSLVLAVRIDAATNE